MHRDPLIGHLTESNRLAIIVKAHLWVEQLLSQAIGIAVPAPIHLSQVRLTFAQKLTLAQAMGAVPPDRVDAIRYLNKVRNQAAHRIDWNLDDAEGDALTHALLEGTDWKPDDSLTSRERMTASLAHLIGSLQGWNQLSEDHKQNKMVRFAHSVLLGYLMRDGLDPAEAKSRVDAVFPFPPLPTEEDLRGN